MLKLTNLIVAAILIACSSVAGAYEAGDIFLRGGLANVSPDESSDGIAVPAISVPAIAGTGAEVDNNVQIGITATYMLTDRVGLELLAATPFSHDITANLSAAGFGSVPAGETKHLPPTLSVTYYPFGSGAALKPYIGAGINYTIFFDEEADPTLEAATPAVVNALTGMETLPPSTPVDMDLDLDDSFGLALQIGFDYVLNDRWHVNGSLRWIDIDTDATFTSALGTTVTVDNVEIDPYVYQLNIGYTF